MAQLGIITFTLFLYEPKELRLVKEHNDTRCFLSPLSSFFSSLLSFSFSSFETMKSIQPQVSLNRNKTFPFLSIALLGEKTLGLSCKTDTLCSISLFRNISISFCITSQRRASISLFITESNFLGAF